MSGFIRADKFRGRVAWEMSPRDARDLAEFLRDNVSPTDGAHADADLLDEMADRIDYPYGKSDDA